MLRTIMHILSQANSITKTGLLPFCVYLEWIGFISLVTKVTKKEV